MLAVGSQAATVVGPKGLLVGHQDLLQMPFYLAEPVGCFRSWETLVFMSGIAQVNNATIWIDMALEDEREHPKR